MVDLRILIATVITGGGAGRVPASWVIRGAIIPLREEQRVGDRNRVEAPI